MDIKNACDRPQAVIADGLFGCEQAPCGAVGYLRAVSGSNVSVGAIKYGFKFCKTLQ